MTHCAKDDTHSLTFKDILSELFIITTMVLNNNTSRMRDAQSISSKSPVLEKAR